MHVAFAITGCALWILGNGIVLWNFPCLGHFCVNSRLRVNLIVDIIATSLIAFWWYGYPEYTLYNLVVPEFKPDGIHAHFLRTLACLVLINILHGVGSIRFHENVDRQGYFFSNLILLNSFLVRLSLSHQQLFFCHRHGLYT
ncbi:hypothetical protein LSAT2_028280 [Lamellibrachia satsuma]|nr:hypothetical protein LSAT2_028280 [Lamellibrachia satsuma]